MLIWNRLKEHAAHNPGKTAIVCGATVLSYGQLVALAEDLADVWLDQGMLPGDRIALHLRNGIPLAIGYYACFAAGFVAVPINTRLLREEIEYVLEHSGARVYIAQPDLRIPTAVRTLDVPILEPNSRTLTHARLLPEPSADAAALLLYTSGTTSRPKGVVHSQRTLVGNASFMAYLGVTPEDHVLLYTPMVHATGSIFLLMSPLQIGATVTIVTTFDPSAVLDEWERSGATVHMGLPTMIRGLVSEQKERPRNLRTGRLAFAGGDTVPRPLQDEYAAHFGHALLEGFGMTEGLPTVINHPERNRPGSIGQPAADTELRVVEGEMWLRGSGIAVGYWGDDPFEDGWLRTGDLVEVDADGYVWFRGRKKEIIIRGGSNISPQEVEETLYRHPAVAEAGVIGEPHPHWGEVVLAYVTLRDGHTASPEELIAFARGRMAEYKCPERVEFLPSLPKGPTGKVQRRALKEINRGLMPTHS